jgi:hypothetical protein
MRMPAIKDCMLAQNRQKFKSMIGRNALMETGTYSSPRIQSQKQV